MDEAEQSNRECPVCHGEVHKEGTVYCSEACLHTWRGLRDHHVRKVVNRVCVMCQKPFTISSWHSRATLTCSYRCSGLYKQHKIPLTSLIEALKVKS